MRITPPDHVAGDRFGPEKVANRMLGAGSGPLAANPVVVAIEPVPVQDAGADRPAHGHA